MEFYMQKLAKKQWQWHSSYTMVSIRAQDFNVVFEDAMKHGHQLLVLDIDTFESSDCFSSSTQQHPNASLLEEIAKWKTLLIDGVEHLILEKFGYICQEQQQQQESDKNQESTASDSFQPQQQLQLPIHPSFRLFLTSFQDVSYFGCLFEDRFPTLDAAIYLDDVQDMILDELWYTKVRLTAPPTESPTIVAKSSPPSHILAASPNTNKSSVMHKSKSLEGRCFQLYICVKELKEVHEEIAEIKANLCDQIDQSVRYYIQTNYTFSDFNYSLAIDPSWYVLR
jgi:hypothetical protein